MLRRYEVVLDEEYSKTRRGWVDAEQLEGISVSVRVCSTECSTVQIDQQSYAYMVDGHKVVIPECSSQGQAAPGPGRLHTGRVPPTLLLPAARIQ